MGEALEVGEERMATAILFMVDVDHRGGSHRRSPTHSDAKYTAAPKVVEVLACWDFPSSSLEPGRLTNWPRAATGRWFFVRRGVLILGVQC